jgi:beta-mannosidase
MMATAQTLSLSGTGWSVREALGETWRWHVAAPLPEARNNVADAAAREALAPGWLAATVPGSVIDDLHRAGELPDPRVGRNSRAAEWVAERHWVYRRRVDVPETGAPLVLEFDGIDPGGIVFWDGVELGSVHGLNHSARFELVDVAVGAHVLAVVVLPAPASEPQVGRTERVTLLAPRMGYGWDFVPRLLHQGIWKDVRLRIGTSPVPTVRVELLGGVGLVFVDGSAELWRGGEVVATGTSVIEVRDPALWWTAGYGEPALYELRVGEHALPVGFREVSMRPNEGGPADALPYTAVVNGVPVPLVGWNWVPADAQYGSITTERVEHLVGLAAASGARILRVWGGGLIESEQFYAACDRAGIFVWQEFSQSSSGMQSAPSTDPAFVEHVRAEAREVVPRLTHHASLLMWGGGNELDEGGVPLDEERSPALAALRDEVARLDPGRHWVATSPTGPVFHNRLDVIAAAPDDQHDVHGPWEHQGLVAHHTLYDAGTSLAHTEFGVEGMTNRRALEALVPEADRWPTGRENPVYRHLGDWWNNTTLVQEVFAGRLDSVELVRRASQWLQSTGLQYAVEADRRRWPRASMVIPWQLNESYPNAWCTSAIDFLGEPKPVFHAVTRAFARERVTVRVDRTAWAGQATARAEAWVWSEPGRAAGSVTLRARGIDGSILAEATSETEVVGHPVAVAQLVIAAPVGLFLWEAEWFVGGDSIDREVVLATGDEHLAALLDLEQAELAVTAVDGTVTVSHIAGPVVVGLGLVDARPAHARGFVTVTGDPRPLLPGQTRSFSASPGAFSLESFNTDPRPVSVAQTLETP